MGEERRMKTKKGRRSESFWPSIVMRKWLNIEPKVHDFSEDEVETESEDDGDENITSTRPVYETNASEKAEAQTEPGTDRRIPSARIHRRKSETLRVNYITNKDVRVMIGTWNVAGKIPLDDLELNEWLDTKETADMYVLGFQEVVPLNAGNVLGAEDSRPIPKWEAIIRRTLNKLIQPKLLFKSYSAPPSSLLQIAGISNGEPKDEKLMPEMSDTSESSCKLPSAENGTFRIEKHSELTKLLEELEWNKPNATDESKKLDWPEYKLDTPDQTVSSCKVLRRNLSESARISFDWLEGAKVYGTRNSALNPGLKRVYHSSGNLGMLWSEQQEACDVLNSLSDVSDRSSEEENLTSESLRQNCETDTRLDTRNSRARYVRIIGKQMVGIYISVWVSRRLRRHVNNLKVSPVGVGLMGYMGNKGSVSVSMTLFQTRLCFVCSHLTSGHKIGDQQKRNADVYDILQRTRFSSALDASHPQTIPSHDRIFWFGDLNYRLNSPDEEVRTLVAMRRWDELMNYDQLSKELKRGHTFEGWKEGMIGFAPTYKYDRNSDRYVGENARDGKKKRSPAWCDRILWLGKGIRQLSYYRSELKLSDHRPVGSKFSVKVEVFDQRKLERVLNFTTAGLFTEKL